MDIPRLPPLRRSVLSKVYSRRHLHSDTYQPPSHDSFSPLTAGSPAHLTLSPSTVNSYGVSVPPNGAQLRYVHGFFAAAPPRILFTAAAFRSLPPSPHPEVAFLGRSNVGKSSLLNALFGRSNIKDAHVSKWPGRTRTMNGFGISGGLVEGAAPKEGQREAGWKRFPRGGVVAVDMPGYGGGSREEWGKEVMKYLEGRKQLRRTFVLVDAEHGLKATDIRLLTHLRRQGIAHQVVLSKVDKLLYPGSKPPSPPKLSAGLMKLQDVCNGIRQRLNAEAADGRNAMMDILCCSSQKGLEEKNKHRKLGIDEVRWAVLIACGVECDENGYRRSLWCRTSDILIDQEDH